MARLMLVTGPPCSGKSTYVAEHKAPGDLVIDYDALAVALGSDDTHRHPDGIRHEAVGLRRVLVHRVRSGTVRAARVWLIACDPSSDEWQRASAVVRMDATRDECHSRAAAAGRPESWHRLIDAWFAARPGLT